MLYHDRRLVRAIDRLSVSSSPLSQQGFTTRRGVDSKSTYPQASCLGFPLPLSSFQGASRSAGAVAGWETYARSPFPSSFFLRDFFSTCSVLDSRLVPTVNRETRSTAATSVASNFLLGPFRFRSGSPLRSPGLSLGCPKREEPGWLEGRRGLPQSFFPVKRLFAAKFSLRGPGGRRPRRRGRRRR